MRDEIGRRDFIKSTAFVCAGVGFAGFGGFHLSAAEKPQGIPNADKLGWRLGIQTWTFHKTSTLYESIDKTASLGLKYIESYCGQKLRPDSAESYRFDMPAAVRKELKQKLADSNVKLLGHFDVVTTRAVFDYCKEMDVEMLTTEPPKDKLETIDRWCKEYDINLYIANHPKPTPYWNPDTVLKVCEGRSKRIGASGDIGHWAREGLVPLDCIKKLEGRLLGFHFRDMDKIGSGTHDVPWGTGVCDVRAMLTEVHRQKIKPVFMVEYEYHEDNSLPDIAQCIQFFDQVAGELVKKG